MSDRNAIAQELTVQQLDAFVSALAAKPGKDRTLAAIKHAAAELGITISLMSAKAFRDTTFERHLDALRRAQSVAQQVEQIEAGGNTLADAGAKLLSQRIFNQLLEAADEDSAAEVDEEKLSLILARLRQGDVQRAALLAKLKETEIKLRDFRRREEERDDKKAALAAQLARAADKKGGLTRETIVEIERSLALL